MTRLFTILPLIALLSVASCASVESTLGVQPIATAPVVAGAPVTTPAPSSALTQATIALTLAEDAANIYKGLPACPSKVNILGCSNPATVAKIQAADKVANDALNTAKALGTPESLATALQTFSDVTAAVPVFSTAKPAS